MKPEHRFVPFHEIKDALQTGDIFLGKGQFAVSHVIEWLQDSPWSHSGMVVRGEDLGIKDPQYELLLWESTRETNLFDVKYHTEKWGPMLVPLEKRISTDITEKWYELFAFRHLNAERSQPMFDSLEATIVETHTATFPTDFKMFWEPLEGRELGIQSKYDNFFCSELLSYTLIKMGLLTKEHPTNYYIPKDFSEQGHARLLQRAWLGPEIWSRSI